MTNSIGIKSVAYSLPENYCMTRDLYKNGIINREQYISMGIERLPVLEPGENILDYASMASQQAIDEAKISKEDIRVLVFFSSSYQNINAISCSNYLIEHLDIPNTIAFGITDVQCAGFHFAIHLCENLLRDEPKGNCGLIVGAESFPSRYVPFGALVSDGASAAVVQKININNNLICVKAHNDGNYQSLYKYDSAHGKFEIRDQEKFKTFIRSNILYSNLRKVSKLALEEALISEETISHLILDNYSSVYQAKAGLTLNIPIEKVLKNDIDQRGHTGGSDVVIGLSNLLKQNKIKKGEYILLASIGLGHTWACSVIRH